VPNYIALQQGRWYRVTGVRTPTPKSINYYFFSYLGIKTMDTVSDNENGIRICIGINALCTLKLKLH
jgi:hypothetical protein